ncbi:hypothetical protein PoB_005602900 [Plakobranchus ocellatus]|uniref:Uncharacterized protein n=1 Tax=Plakobranchus ocellatus TaxID=259542 RepID=A0AAV4CAD7_9GAST|nr:hypothetical protein PoB_005602900 [Plakobranchus ocellatus]
MRIKRGDDENKLAYNVFLPGNGISITCAAETLSMQKRLYGQLVPKYFCVPTIVISNVMLLSGIEKEERDMGLKISWSLSSRSTSGEQRQNAECRTRQYSSVPE